MRTMVLVYLAIYKSLGDFVRANVGICWDSYSSTMDHMGYGMVMTCYDIISYGKVSNGID